jgi:hypothetical protein
VDALYGSRTRSHHGRPARTSRRGRKTGLSGRFTAVDGASRLDEALPRVRIERRIVYPLQVIHTPPPGVRHAFASRFRTQARPYPHHRLSWL